MQDKGPCRKILMLLPRFIEGDFSVEEEKKINEHIKSCPACKKEFEAMKSLMDIMDKITTLNTPSSFSKNIMKMIKPRFRHRKP